MTGLAWFIYFAGIFGALKALAAAAAFFLWPMAALFRAVGQTSGPDEIGNLQWRGWLVWFAVLSSAAVLIPTEQTVYLMAGAHVAETAATSDVGQAMLEDVQAIIRNKLAEMGRSDG